jgi:hypothetical protein
MSVRMTPVFERLPTLIDWAPDVCIAHGCFIHIVVQEDGYRVVHESARGSNGRATRFIPHTVYFRHWQLVEMVHSWLEDMHYLRF